MKIKTYKSGLRVVVNTKSDLDIVYVRFFVKCGSINENVEEYGIAHFLEHMFFKSTEKTNYLDIAKKFDSLGTSYNAYTGNSKTCFYFKCIKDKLEETLLLFSEMLNNYSFNKNEINKEKSVVLEEIKKDADDFERESVKNALSNLFVGTKYEHDVLGTSKKVKSFNAQMLKDFKKKNYIPNNFVVSFSGNIKMKEAEKLLKKNFSYLFDGEYKGDYPLEKYLQLSVKEQFVAKQKDSKQSNVTILIDMGEKDEEQAHILAVLMSVLGGDMSSKLFTRIRNELGYVYSIFSSSSKIGQNALAEIYFATSTENVEKALKNIVKILYECAQGNITEEEIQIVKNKYLAEIVYSNETNSSISSRNGASLLNKNKIKSFNQVEQEIKSINLSQVIEMAKELYYSQKFVVSSVGKATKKQLQNFKH